MPNDDGLWVGPDGRVMNIRDIIADVKSGAYKGKDTSGQYRLTEVFVKRNGEWVCMATANQLVKPVKP